MLQHNKIFSHSINNNNNKIRSILINIGIEGCATLRTGVQRKKKCGTQGLKIRAHRGSLKLVELTGALLFSEQK